MIEASVFEKLAEGDEFTHGALFAGLDPDEEILWRVELVAETQVWDRERRVLAISGFYMGVPIGPGMAYLNSQGEMRIVDEAGFEKVTGEGTKQ